jgi:20S proteasome subunit beta 4
MDTIFGITGAGFALIAADRSAQFSIVRLKDDEDKILPIDHNKLLALGGDTAHRKELGDLIQKNIHLYYFRNSVALDTRSSAHFIRSMVAENLRRGPYQADMILAGYDEADGASMYYLDYLSTMHKVNKIAHGHGGNFLLGLMDNMWKPVRYSQNLTLEEGKQLIQKCIEELKRRFLVAQPQFMVKCVDSVRSSVERRDSAGFMSLGLNNKMSEEVKHGEGRARTSQEEHFLMACQRGSIEDCKKLLQSGLDINFKDRNGSTPLFYCTSDEQLELARFLIFMGASLNETNVRGNTMLHVACERGSRETVLLFLLHGADPTIKNADGRKPEDLNSSMKPLIYAVSKDREPFRTLSDMHKKRIAQIFDDIDTDLSRRIDLGKSMKFNRYMEDVPEEVARRDAQDFLRDCSICNPGYVNYDEWLFTFSKLNAEKGPEPIDKFIEEYEKRVKENGKFTDYKVRD